MRALDRSPIPRRRFTIDEYHRMGEAGVLSEDDRVELLDGEIVQMTPIGAPHASCVDRLNALLARRLGKSAIVRVQNPIILDRRSEPQPDLALLAPRSDFYSGAHPRPRDVLLAIEVMDASRGYDRTLKLSLYARAELREVWAAGRRGAGEAARDAVVELRGRDGARRDPDGLRRALARLLGASPTRCGPKRRGRRFRHDPFRPADALGCCPLRSRDAILPYLLGDESQEGSNGWASH
jgi:Uma2 family endonuclease